MQEGRRDKGRDRQGSILILFFSLRFISMTLASPGLGYSIPETSRPSLLELYPNSTAGVPDV